MQVIKSFNIFLDNISRQELPQQFLKFRGAVASTVSYTHKFNDNLNVSCATKAGGLGISSKMGYSW